MKPFNWPVLWHAIAGARPHGLPRRQPGERASIRTDRRTACLLFLGAAVPLSGCGATGYMFPDTATSLVRIQAAGDANDGFPVAVDVVIVTDETLAPVLSSVTARDWFSGKAQYIADNPGKLVVKAFEVVPGQAVADIEFSRADRAATKAVLIFANYMRAGVHRARVETIERVLVALEREQFRTVSL
jgi:type VI secretion system protein